MWWGVPEIEPLTDAEKRALTGLVREHVRELDELAQQINVTANHGFWDRIVAKLKTEPVEPHGGCRRPNAE